MTEEWPIYHKGRRDHLHTLGVIALSYSAFERGLISIYSHHCAQQNMPFELVQLYYSSLNEKSQLKVIKTIFTTYEKEPAALEFVSSLIDYFNWCSDVRNTFLHSELYPTLFCGDADKLYLMKPQSKREPSSTYMWLTVEELRDIADKIEHGKRECAGFLIYLRCRDIPVDRLPLGYHALGGDQFLRR
jgi:hypothetical protein